ncbi:hypothetical protein IVB12_16115 [Bradyrhizobium sp. 179]|uniref:hypothetical protein n=1 Tax=Bradyrhizobium sp. 179 TaxID=2782648 RepID=UPI001FFBF760|nr:hypothetical protein [Bradyrhizobium sp. 179]MCK1543443.1 hypothetical protein [Bradyrhizobium sp. 179]
MTRALERGLKQLRQNYIVNGGMMVSQENGSTAGTITSYYPVDQFRSELNLTTGTLSYAQVASLTPGGSPNRIRITVTAANAALGSAEYADVMTKLEGNRVVDLRLGTANAKQFVLQFGVRAPAGTYSVAYSNGAGDRTYVAEYTISAGEANTDVVKSVVVTGDLVGTWATDSSAGLQIRFAVACGATNKVAPGAWGAGLFVAATNQFNLMGTVGNVFELFDVGLYEGTVAPAFQLPDFPSELALCQRYYEAGQFFHSLVSGVQINRSLQFTLPFKAVKRNVPTMSLSSVTNLRSNSTAVASVTADRVSISFINTNADGDDFNTGGVWKASARM